MSPSSTRATRRDAAVVEWAIAEAGESVAIRLAIGPSPRRIELPDDYRLEPGRGALLLEGTEAVAFAYGPVMLTRR